MNRLVGLAHDRFGARVDGGTHHLECDISLDGMRLPRAVNTAHPAAADQRFNLVLTGLRSQQRVRAGDTRRFRGFDQAADTPDCLDRVIVTLPTRFGAGTKGARRCVVGARVAHRTSSKTESAGIDVTPIAKVKKRPIAEQVPGQVEQQKGRSTPGSLEDRIGTRESIDG